MCKTIKITGDDNFVWRLVTVEQAKKFFDADIDSLYALYDDDTESLVHDLEEIDELAAKGAEFGLEVGFTNYREVENLEAALKAHDFYYERSDDHSMYERGRDSLDNILHLADKVSHEDYVKCWNKCAPKDLKFK